MSLNPSSIQRVAIIGGGVAGLTLAIALQRKGFTVSVHEKYSHDQSHATGFLIWSYAIKILQDLDVPIDACGAPLEVFRMHGRKGRALVDMPIGPISRRHGADSYEVNRLRLHQTLAAMVGDDLKLGHDCISVRSEADHAIATFADGSSVQADVVIACDGANSAVRRCLHPEVRLRMLDSGGWIAVIDQIPEGLPVGYQMDFWQAGCKAGVAHIGHGQVRWYVGFTGFQPLDSEPKKDQIRHRMTPLPDLIQRCLDLTEDEQMVSTQAGDLLALTPWYRGRVLMIGDAAHATSPYAGMGACAAIADAAALADLLGSGLPVPDLFQRFQDIRKPAADAVIQESRVSLRRTTCGGVRAWLRDWLFRQIPDQKMDEIVTAMVLGQ